MNLREIKATIFAMLSAILYAVSSPISKLLLKEISPTLMAGFLYLGAGLGMSILGLIKKKTEVNKKEAKLTKNEIPYTIAMVLLDILAPIFLMIGLTYTSSANASLLNNFEIVATSIIALMFFKEAISKRLWVSISLITLSSILLTVEDISSVSFSFGSILVIMACICWGIENNCTRRLAIKDPLEIVVIKGFGSGIGSLLITFIIGERRINMSYIIMAMILGFFAYGLSIFFYIYAQRDLGAAKTSTYYAISPFIGVALSFIIFRDIPNILFSIALIIMIIGTYFASTEVHNHNHKHRELNHEHSHCHNDGHHKHLHKNEIKGYHSHVHYHTEVVHSHKHTQDIHHSHSH